MSQKNLSIKEPKPIENNSLPEVWDLVIQDMKDRNEYGIKKHGMPLRPFNGRNTLNDIFQELMDSIVYVRSKMYEEDHLTTLLIKAHKICEGAESLNKDQCDKLSRILSEALSGRTF